MNTKLQKLENIKQNLRNDTTKSQSIKSSSISSDSSALQQSIAKRFNLPGSRIQTVISTKNSNDNFLNKDCSSCMKSFQSTSNLCSHCGYFNETITQKNSDDLAIFRGILPVPPQQDTLIKFQWDLIEYNTSSRLDSHCPICMIGFTQSNELLLSCGHLFHSSCLLGFEKFANKSITERSCPICRHPKYQKRTTNIGTKSYQYVCCRIIQSNWRKWFAKMKYHEKLKEFYKSGHGNTILRRKFFQQEFTLITNNFINETITTNKEVDNIMSSSEKTLLAGRELDALFNNMLLERQGTITSPVSHVSHESSSNGNRDEWDSILQTAISRGIDECPICMCPNRAIPFRPLAILNCSHMFHHTCILNAEKFLGNKSSSCPICRINYKKLILDQQLFQSYLVKYL